MSLLSLVRDYEMRCSHPNIELSESRMKSCKELFAYKFEREMSKSINIEEQSFFMHTVSIINNTEEK